MTCEERAALIPSLGDGSLGSSQERELEAHVESCERCQGLQQRLRKVEELLEAGLRVPDPGEIFFRAQRNRILTAGPTAAGTLKQPRKVRFVWAAAAAILILAAGAAYWLGVPASSGPVGTARRPSLPPPVPQAPDPLKGPGTAPLTGRSPEPSPAPPVMPPPGPRESGPRSAPPSLPEPVRQPVPPPLVAREASPPLPSATPGRVAAMTEESVDIGLAETPKDRVLALYRAAEARLGELGQAIRRDPPLASELADAYLLLLGEGVKSVLHDRAESAQDLALARSAAAERARGHERALVELGGTATGKLKETLEEALAMSRDLGKP
ncbi:MAG TPA: zf-HC2 domain-containing protein [Planctomycetota bacterium]|nr:zf-HC2 domain-containing protein [Planctomycetota bacterium]